MICASVFMTPAVDANAYAFLYPLCRFQKEINDAGIRLGVHMHDERRGAEGDIALVTSKYLLHKFQGLVNKFYQSDKEEEYKSAALEEITSIKKRFNRVIFCDIQDSTGTIQNFIIDHVDGYAKGQLCKDRNLYLDSWVGSRIFTDFAYRQLDSSVASEDLSVSAPLRQDQLGKLKLLWNSGLGYHSLARPLWQKIHYLFLSRGIIPPRWFFQRPGFCEVNRRREVEVSCRVSYGERHVLYQYFRRPLSEQLAYREVNSARLDRVSFFKELKNSKIAVSPFGFGEITLRDFETVLSGAALVKQDMSHLDTWPNIYVNGDTYVPIKWDSSDFVEVIEDLLTSNSYRDVAHRSQALYSAYFETELEAKFIDHFVGLIQPKAVQ